MSNMADSGVSSFLLKKDKERAENKKRSRGKEKRITIILSEYDFRRLKYIAKHFGDLRSVLARNLIIESLADAEKILEFNEYDEGLLDSLEEWEPMADAFTEYGRFINGLTEDDDSEEDGTDDSGESSDVKKSPQVKRPKPPVTSE
jgi:hypothetical protein